MDTKPSMMFQSQRVIDFNRSHYGKIDLTEEALMYAACEQARFDNSRIAALTPLLPALRALLHSINIEADLTPFGQAAAQNRILTSLKNQLWANACFERHPEIRQRKIVGPVIIIGPHRSGTTRILQLLATDARLRHLRAWEGVNPAPRLDKADAGIAERYAEARRLFEARAQCYPEVHMAHPMHPDWPEEEMLLMNHSFSGFSPLGFYVAPSYAKWFLQDDKQVGYRNMADLLRLISWSTGESDARPWILKNPQHMLNLPTLLHTFPDARLVFVHRDPLKMIGSVISMMWWCAVQHTDMPCRIPLRDVWLSFCENAARRSIEARQGIASSHMFDVHFTDMNRDWETVMRRIYDFIGMELTPSVQQAMTSLIARDNEDRRFGQCPPYRLEEFGISEQEVDERMMFYRRQYDIAYESSAGRAARTHRLAPGASAIVIPMGADQSIATNQMAKRIYREAFNRMGIPLRFVYGDESWRADMAKKEYVDGEIARVRGYGDAHPHLIRVEESLFEIRFSLFAGRPDLTDENMADMADSSFHMQIVRGTFLARAILEKRFPLARITEAANYQEAIAKLLSGESSLFCGIEHYVAHYVAKTLKAADQDDARQLRKIATARTEPVFPYLLTKHAGLAQRLAVTLREMKDDGWLKAIDASYWETASA